VITLHWYNGGLSTIAKFA